MAPTLWAGCGLRPALPLLAVLALVLSGCGLLRDTVPFEPGAARYTFDVRAERDLSGPGAVGVAAVTDTRTGRRLLIDRFAVPEGASDTFAVEDPETGARFDLAVTAASGRLAYVGTVRKGGRLIATSNETVPYGDPPPQSNDD